MSIDLKTDGRFYEPEEMVRANCQDCIGCCDCCTGMGDTIVLDPYDVRMLKNNCGKTMEQLLQQGLLSLGMAGGLILPHIQMNPETDCCPFLSDEGRCSIHAYRPGICRLFPLGRNFEDGKLTYILLTDECKKQNRSKIKVSQWIGIKPAEKYHNFILEWHTFRKNLTALLAMSEEARIKEILMLVLKTFYYEEWLDEGDIFAVLSEKIKEMEKRLGMGYTTE
nr:YkgJ family cysteine cluster protein [Lachnospiraceae bacterium]